MLKLKEKMYAEVSRLRDKYGDNGQEAMNELASIIKSKETYEETLDIIPLVFAFDKDIAILQFTNNTCEGAVNSSKEITKYINEDILAIYHVFKFNYETAMDHIILTHAMYSKITDDVTNNTPNIDDGFFKWMEGVLENELSSAELYTANEKDGISIVQGSLKDLLNLYFGKNKDNEM